MLENIIAYHCGPALAGIKPANIASCYKAKIPNIYSEINRLNNQLNCKDIYIEILCNCEKRVLIMVYRKKVLEKHLQNPEIINFLNDFGYSSAFGTQKYINHLKSRISKCSVFPHEIGVFLGYPLHDVYGFINHRDDGCILIGEWKVYEDAEGAKKLFSRYKACRSALVKRIEKGFSLAQIFCAA